MQNDISRASSHGTLAALRGKTISAYESVISKRSVAARHQAYRRISVNMARKSMWRMAWHHGGGA